MLPRTFQNMSPPCCILSSVETARLKGHSISALFARPTILRYSVRRRKLPVYRTNILPAVLAAFLSVCAWERTQLAAVSGAITDPSGAVAPGASVTVVNQGTALKRGVLTDSADECRFAGLRTGTCSLRIEMPGFQPQIRAGVELTSVVLDFDNADIQSPITLERPNVVGNPNFAVPSHTQNPPVMSGNGDAVFKAAAGSFAANVKQILTTAGAARQIQLAGRFIF